MSSTIPRRSIFSLRHNDRLSVSDGRFRTSQQKSDRNGARVEYIVRRVDLQEVDQDGVPTGEESKTLTYGHINPMFVHEGMEEGTGKTLVISQERPGLKDLPAPTSDQTSIMDLPVEVRYKIFSYVFATRESTIKLLYRRLKDGEVKLQPATCVSERFLSPLHVSKAFAEEGYAVLLLVNSLLLPTPRDATMLLMESITTQEHLTHLEISTWTSHSHKQFMLALVRATGLLRLTIHEVDRGTCAEMAKSLLPWILANGKTTKTVEWLTSLLVIQNCSECMHAQSAGHHVNPCYCSRSLEGPNRLEAELLHQLGL